jgi:hypothetical protein
MPLITCEMRWFLRGALPPQVERWFEGDGARTAPVWREDRYVLSGLADMGIKQREGRVEVKGRTAKLGAHVLAPDIEGSAERWCKWSYDAAAIADGFRGCLQGCETLVIAKGRVQRHFLLHPGGLTEGAAQRDLARRGFSVELTQIRVPSAGDHWSLGIEAAPDDAALLGDLLRALGEVLRGFPLPLPRTRARSYPQWLARLQRDAGES